MLEGMLLEARGLEAEAKAFYQKMLVLDETSIVSPSFFPLFLLGADLFV